MATKQTSRKGKKAWRKNVDITELHEGLEQLRNEVVAGGIIKEKPDEVLFTLDTTGAPEIAKAHLKHIKPLKCDEILLQRSAVPALENKKRVSSTFVTDGVVPEKKKHRANGVSYKELERLRRIAYGMEQNKDLVKVSDAAAGQEMELFDPWEDVVMGEGGGDGDAEEEGELNSQMSFLEKTKKKVVPVTMKKPPISLAASKAPIPAVRLPDAGISYNPEFDKWDNLITKEGQKEVLAEQKRLAEAAEEARIAAINAIEDVVPSSDEESESEEEDEDGEKAKQTFLKKRPERKTQAQRNKVKRRKEAEREVVRLAHIRRQRDQLQALKSLAKAVTEKERKKLQMLATGNGVLIDADNETIRRRRLGKHALPKPPLELQLPEELTDSLRRLKPEGNLLRDRFRSLRERGILETRSPIGQRKKVKRKVTEKWSYKDWSF